MYFVKLTFATQFLRGYWNRPSLILPDTLRLDRETERWNPGNTFPSPVDTSYLKIEKVFEVILRT